VYFLFITVKCRKNSGWGIFLTHIVGQRPVAKDTGYCVQVSKCDCQIWNIHLCILCQLSLRSLWGRQIKY